MANNKKIAKKPDPNMVQRRASDPKSSVWVTASAGTGKTKVLTDRVLRLMLEGSQPENILCVTFTNAAASVMKNRIREELELWATCSDTVLNTKLRKLTGRKASEKTIARARQLFAEYLDTPNGMKIQTIHSFCQSMLKRFPVETGIPPYFDVLDEQSAFEMLKQAQADILQQVQDEPDTKLADAVRRITPEVSEDDFMALMGEITYRRGELLSVFEQFGGDIEDPSATIQEIYKYLGIKEGSTGKNLRKALCSNAGIDNNRPDLDKLYLACDILTEGTKTDKEKATIIRDWLDGSLQDREEILQDYIKVFLTDKGEIRKRLTTKNTIAAQNILEKEANRIINGLEIIKTVNVARGTEALLTLASAILTSYREKKKAINALDYDDLIYKTLLFLEEDDGSAWALQKLDGDLKHILVDEAQDTNPDQWAIIAAITKEFFKSKNTKKKIKIEDRTMFVVGDEKQSIFSFQRADPKEFENRREFFKEQVTKAGGKWQHVKMEVTFRSSPAIMQVVDAVFKNDEAADGLRFNEDKDDEITHKPFRLGQGGEVKISPIVKSKGLAPLPAWPIPTEREESFDPAVEIAENIADEIKNLIDSGEKLKARGRAIVPSDIMILVRRRSRFVDDMIRALKKRDIPVAGADRISLREQISVMDLVAIGEFSQFPRDDYKLAVILKSPFIGLSDKELERIALNRKGTLWEALQEKGKTTKKYQNIVEYLKNTMKMVEEKRPYDFYAEFLMRPCPANKNSALFAIYSRLGFDAEDAIVEFMNSLERFERVNTPSMQGFLVWINAGKSEIKREIDGDSSNPKVRIMTIHSAKGLEAPIVIMPDTTTVPANNTRTRPKLLWPNDNRKIPLWVPRAELENKKFTEERLKIEKERDQEYRRLLYVAMTRAEDRLYVYGYQNSKNRPNNSWYDLIKNGVEENLKDEIEYLGEKGEIIKFNSPQTARPKDDGVRAHKKRRKSGVPAWARKIAPKAKSPVKKFTPSIAFKQTKNIANDNKINGKNIKTPFNMTAESKDQKIGNIVHHLLEYLPTLEDDNRKKAAKLYLSKPAWKLSLGEQERIYKQIDKIISDKDFGILFGKNSRAEVTIGGKIIRDGEEYLMTGNIDRLVVGEKTVWIVDYKNSKYIPKTVNDISKQYIAQMAAYREALKDIYPNKKIKCTLLWTREAKMQAVPDKMMDKICQDMKIKPRGNKNSRQTTSKNTNRNNPR